MTTSASIDLVFNAKDNTKSTFQSLNQGLNQSKVAVDKAAAGFASLSQSVQDFSQRSVRQLNQSFITATSVLKRFFEAGVIGAAAFSEKFLAIGQASLAFGRIFREAILDPFFQAQSLFGGKSFFDLYLDEITAATLESVTFSKSLKNIGDSIVELKQLNLQESFAIPKPTDFSRLSPEAATRKLQDVQAANERFGLPAPASIEEGIRQLEELEAATRRQQATLEERKLGDIKEISRRFGLPDPQSVEAGIAALEKLERQLRIKAAAASETATVFDKLRFRLDLFSQSTEKAAQTIYANFLPSLGAILGRIKQLDTKVFETANTIGSISVGLGGALTQIAGYDEAIASFNELRKGAGAFAEAVGNVSQQIFFFQSAFQSITQIAATGPFKLLIGQQVQLRQQLLETQSTLVATNKIVDSFSGEQLNRPFELGGDPGQAIVALSGATESAIKQLRKDSLELVGVTSSQLAEVFNVTTTNLASVGIETENLLGESADLTIKFAAALGTIGLPLNQARQEISSILQGTIDNNSVLAKTLNLSNAQITKYKEQGNLLEKLNEKLKPFQAGNAIAAKSLEGVTSNIQEVFEVVALEAGKPLLDPLLEGLNQFYQFLADNQGAFARFLAPIIQDILRIQEALFGAGRAIGSALGGTLGNVFAGIARSAANFLTQLTTAITETLGALRPFISILESVTSIFGAVENTFGGVIVKLVVFGKTLQLLSGSLNLFLNLIRGVGEIRFVLEKLGTGVFAQFVNLKDTFSVLSSATLTLGLNFERLSAAFPAINKELAKSLGGFGFLAPTIASLIPKISALLLGLAGLPTVFRNIGNTILSSIPKIDAFLTKFTLVGRIVSFVAGKIVASIIAIQAALTAAGFGDIASKLDDVVIAFQKIETGKFQDGLKGLGGVFNGLGDAAEAGLGKIDKSIEGVAKGKFGELSKAAVASAVSFGLWSIAIAGAGIALSEFLQRRQDQGQNIRDISDSLTRQADAIKNIKSDNLKAFNGRIKDGDELTKDWVDKIIILNRNFKLSELSYDNLGESILSTGKVIVVFFSRLAGVVVSVFNTIGVALGQSSFAFGRFFQAILKGAQTAASSLLDVFSSPVKLFSRLFTGVSQAWAGDFAGAKETFATLFDDIAISDRTKQLGREVQLALGDAGTGIVDTVKTIGSGLGEAYDIAVGDAIGKTLTKVEVGLEQTAKEVATGELAASAKELGRVLREELVPNDAKFKTISAALAESVADIGSASATAGDRLNAVNDAINQVRAIGDTGIVDPKSIQESITLLEDFRFETLDAAGNLKDASEEGKEAFDNQKTALRQALSLSLQQGRNIELGAKTDKVQAELTAVSDQLTTLEEKSRAGVLDPEGQEAVVELRRVKTELEGIVETYDKLRQDTQPLADPVQLYANAINNAEKQLKKLQGTLTFEQQEGFADAAQKNLDRTIKEEIVGTTELEKEKLTIRKTFLEKNLAATEAEIAKIQEKRDTLTDFELERAEELNDQFIQLKTRRAQQETELIEASVQEQQAIREAGEKEQERILAGFGLQQQERTQSALQSFLQRKAEGEIVSTKDLEREKLEIQRRFAEQNLANTQKEVDRIQGIRNRLTKAELANAKGLDDKFTELKTKQAQQQIDLFELTIQEQQAIREEAERSIQEELQKTKNETEEIKLSIKEQELAYDGILKKIDQQNALLNEGRKLVDAQAQSALSGLDFLKENARSASRQKVLAETTAAIRLQSVREQIKFEEISLRLEQQKTELALQREAIAANISRLEAEAGLAQAQAELEKINLPGSEATVAERKAAEISVRAAAQRLRGTQQAERLIAEQATQQKTLFELQRKSFAVESANKERTARFAAASAIASPVRRRRAIRGLEEEESRRVAGLIGIDPNSFDGAAGFGRQLRGANLQFQRSEGFAAGAPSNPSLAALEAISPEIADLTGAARDQAIAQAARQLAQSTPFLDQAATPLGIPTGQQFQLQTSQPAILQQLFTPVQNTLGLAATNIGKAAQGFDTLITELRAIAAKPTYNLTVTAGGSSFSTGGAATSTPDLQRVLATAKRLVTNGLF